MEQYFGLVIHFLKAKLSIVLPSLLVLLTPCSSTQPTVVATSPVQHVVEDGIISLHCEFNYLDDSHTVRISRIVQNNPEVLSWETDVKPQIDERIFLAVRQLEGGTFVHFLTIMDVTQYDSGVYVCQIFGEIDLVPMEISRDSVTINVLYFPKTVACMPQNTPVAYADDLVTFNCTTGTSNPPVSFQWIRTGSREAMSSVENNDGQIYSELSFRPKMKDNGAGFLCEISSLYFPEEKLSCHVGPLSLSPNPANQNRNNNWNSPDHGDIVTDVVRGITNAKELDVHETVRKMINCEDSCSKFTTPTMYWIIGTAVASLFAIVFLIIGLILMVKLCAMQSSELNDVFYSPQPTDDIYAQLEGRIDGNRVYMTLEKPRKMGKSGNIDQRRSEGQYFVPVLGPQL